MHCVFISSLCVFKKYILNINFWQLFWFTNLALLDWIHRGERDEWTCLHFFKKHKRWKYKQTGASSICNPGRGEQYALLYTSIFYQEDSLRVGFSNNCFEVLYLQAKNRSSKYILKYNKLCIFLRFVHDLKLIASVWNPERPKEGAAY